MFERSRKGERALLIQPFTAGHSDPSLLEEFSELARSAGGTVVGSVSARIDRPNPVAGSDGLFYYTVKNTQAKEIAATITCRCSPSIV